jgi:YHS domain-containing protein
MKHRLIVFALGALIAHNTSAMVTNFLSDGVVLFHPGMRVWIEKGAHKLNLDSNGAILKGYDVVAYFTQHRAIKGSSKSQNTYQGATYYFSSAADLALFKKNPSKYIPQYGGFCANGMKNRQANDIDPNVFSIIRGKLYLCASPKAEKEFRSNQGENIKKADQNWDEEYRWFY